MTRYLCDKYDKEHRLLPPVGDPKRYAVLQWVHAAEATYTLHSIAILYARWHQQSGNVEETEARLSKNVQNDLNYFQSELKKSGGKFLFGDQPTVADMQMHFSLSFIVARELGTKDMKLDRIQQYVKDCEAVPSYKAAVEKTGHTL